MKLLIVEDNPSVRSILRRMVRSLADEILECADGLESVRLYQAEQPDYVLMDINLGNSDGIDLTQQIKSIDPAARVIIVTNYDEPDLRQAARDAGAIGFVPKDDLSLLHAYLKQ